MNDNNKHKHHDVIIAFANGAQIEGRPTPNSAWTLFSNPSWENHWEYRIKPEEHKPWKPKEGEIFWVVDLLGGKVGPARWFDGSKFCNDAHSFGNCFQTKKEAKAAIPRVKVALKGGDSLGSKKSFQLQLEVKDAEIKTLKDELEKLKLKISAPSSTNFQLDRKPLSDGEKALIRALRDCDGIQTVYEPGKTILVSAKGNEVMADSFSVSFLTNGRYTNDLTIVNALNQIKKEQKNND